MSFRCSRFIVHDKSSPTVAAVSVHQPRWQSAKQQAALAESSNPISIKTNQGLSYVHPPWVKAPSLSCLPQHMLGVLYEEWGGMCPWQPPLREDRRQYVCMCVHALIIRTFLFNGGVSEGYGCYHAGQNVGMREAEQHIHKTLLILSQAWALRAIQPR